MSNDEHREWLEENTEVLRSSNDPSELEAAAVQLAASDDPDAIQRLGGFLSQSEFLGRLDELSVSGRNVVHLSNVLKPFIEQPSPETAAVCLKLAEDEVFQSDDDRTPFLLEALARVTPMQADTVKFFRRTSDESYFAANAPLLVANGSPAALTLFVSMMADREIEQERRVDCLHISVVMYRTRLSTLQAAADLLTRDLEQPVEQGVIESVFDFHWQWFGSRPPEPPAWRTADDAALRFLAELGEANRRPDLPPSLLQAIDGTIGIARALLQWRNRT